MVRPFEIVLDFAWDSQGRNDLTPRIRFGAVGYIPGQDRWKGVMNGRFGFARDTTAQTTSPGTEENQLPTGKDRDACASSKVLTVERKGPGSKSSSDFLGRSPKIPGSRD
jgi:hypothetical protein